MNRTILGLTVAVCLVAIVGCTGSAGKPTTAPKAPAPIAKNPDAVKLDGPGGSVALGDDLAAAKKAFPPPKDGHVFDLPMSFTMVATEGWAWTDKDGKEGFEAAIRDGKIIGLAVMKSERQSDEPGSIIQKIGEPTRKAEGKTAKLYVWENGDDARFWMTIDGASSIFNIGSLMLIGNKKDLRMMNYRADDPETFVKQQDVAAERVASGNSPLSDAIKDAKKKADEKAKK